jgi:hypothetical protein
MFLSRCLSHGFSDAPKPHATRLVASGFERPQRRAQQIRLGCDRPDTEPC